tara:strand:+ start:1310 stop:1501 length:192 start_codon:yes stop_codon:yes gene_type:complete
MKKIQEGLNLGRTISQYPTGNSYGYSSYFRWDDTKEVVNSKSVLALKRRGLEINIPIVSEIVR